MGSYLDTLRYTGMRLNQLIHLRLIDVNLDEGYIELRQAGSKNHREWRVPVVPHLHEALTVLMQRAWACGAKGSDALFHVTRLVCSESERSLLPVIPPIQPIRSFFRRLSRDCGFHVSPHRFRHTLATTLMTAPERNLHLVKGLLGHSTVTTTMEYIDINLEVVGQTLERELALHTDLYSPPGYVA